VPWSSSTELSPSRAWTSTSDASQQHRQQQQHPFVSARVDQFTSRHQLTALQPSKAGGAPAGLAGRKLSDDDSLDRLVEINARQLVGRGVTAVRRHPQATSVAALPSSIYTRAKALPVTNNVAKPFSTGRNY